MCRIGVKCIGEKYFQGSKCPQKNIWCSVPTLQESGQGTKEFGYIDLKFSEFMEAAKLGGLPWCTMVYHGMPWCAMRRSGFGRGAAKGNHSLSV